MIKLKIKDVTNDNIVAGVENETGYNYIVTVGTPQDLLEEMNQKKTNFIGPYIPMIMVKNLTEEIIVMNSFGKVILFLSLSQKSS